MHKRLLPLLLLAFGAFSGCRTNPACERQVGLMRSELLSLEDKYYLLEAKYREAVGSSGSSLEGCDLTERPLQTPNAPATINPSRPTDGEIRIQLDPKDSSQFKPRQAISQVVEELPAAVQNAVVFQTPARFSSNQYADDRAPSGLAEASVLDTSAGERSNQPSAAAPSRPAENSIRNELSSDDRGEESGPLLVDPSSLKGLDSGVALVVHIPAEHWSADGSLTVALIDPNAVPEYQRIGLWRFNPTQIEQRIEPNDDPTSVAIPLELGANQDIPRDAELRLFVRWEPPQLPAVESSHRFALQSPSPTADSATVGYQQRLQDDQATEQSFEEISALPQTTAPPLGPEWRPNR